MLVEPASRSRGLMAVLRRVFIPCSAGTGLGTAFVEGRVEDPMQPVLHAPMASRPGRERRRCRVRASAEVIHDGPGGVGVGVGWPGTGLAFRRMVLPSMAITLRWPATRVRGSTAAPPRLSPTLWGRVGRRCGEPLAPTARGGSSMPT
jgi:hypothetical protein